MRKGMLIMGTKVVCPGSFDPVTKGHERYIRLAARLFDKAEVLVMKNCNKKDVFTSEQRFELARLTFEDVKNIKVVLFEGFLAGYCRDNSVDAIVKGVRNAADFDYEMNLSEINRSVSGVESIFLPSDPEVGFVSSTFVRELIRYGRDCSPYVPKNSLLYLKKINKKI